MDFDGTVRELAPKEMSVEYRSLRHFEKRTSRWARYSSVNPHRAGKSRSA